MAWILIPASAIFLERYGSELLPVTYIGAAVAGLAVEHAARGGVSPAAAASRWRRSPWLGCRSRSWRRGCCSRRSDADWVSFALLVLVPIVVPVGFIFVVGQAGMLLDVRVAQGVLRAGRRRLRARLRGRRPRRAAAARRSSARTESVLGAAAAAAGLFLALVVVTRRRYPAELSVIEHATPSAERPTLRALARNRYVMLIVAFQMLSAVESQWLDFHVLDRARRSATTSSDALARFVSQFSAIAYGTDILFLLVVAGLLLRRFGLRYGLTANAVGVLVARRCDHRRHGSPRLGRHDRVRPHRRRRVADLTFSDGTSRTSLSAAYQALPTGIRSVAQATVEGLAVPVAIGVSGVVLLVFQSIGGTEGVMLPVLTTVVVTRVGRRGNTPVPRVPDESAREPARPLPRPG